MKARKKKVGRRVFLGVMAALLVVTTSGAVAAGRYLAPYASAHMDLALLETVENSAPSVLLVYDPTLREARTGTLHPAEQGTLRGSIPRPHTEYADMPPDLISAFVSIEDKRFFRHKGIDPIRTARATWGYLTGNPTCGGSTITQQLVKNLTGHDEQTPDRKLTEIFQALDLERQVGKERVLEAYLNVVNLAEGCFGVGMAAERYFGKAVWELSLPECASLAAITQNPARYNPVTHPTEHLRRRDLVLSCMAEQGYITKEELAEATAFPLTLAEREDDRAEERVNSWYTDLVISDVIRDLKEELGYTESAASRLVYFGGLTIETAQDETLQRAVEDYYADPSHFPAGEGERPQSSCIIIDPYTGDILAVAGATGNKTADRVQNYATDTRRPAGSCIKPLSVYAPALERGLITWGSILTDEPLTEDGGRPWPANADGLYRGRVTLGEAVARSLNPPAVEILERVGTAESLAFLREKLGIRGLIPLGGTVHDCTLSSLALGQQSVGVTSRELTAAYTVLYGGSFREAVSYHRVLDREGNVLLENPPCPRPVLSVETAAILTRLLMEVNSPALGGTASRYLEKTPTLGMETAGKTGTTQGGCDRRYIGMTPRLLTGIWMGYDYPAIQGGITGNPCVGIWDDLIVICEELYRGTPRKTAFDLPDTLVEVEICRLSGCLPNPFCKEHGKDTFVRGWFVKGTHPTAICPLHEEPPITVVPHDPADPNRIPTLPNDLLPTDPLPNPSFGGKDTPSRPEKGEDGGPLPWISRWFSRFSRR